MRASAFRTPAVPTLLLFLALCLTAAATPAIAAGAGIILIPPDWDFGTLIAGNRARGTLEVTNTSPRTLTVSVIPTCDCLTTGPSRISLSPGSRGRFQLTILAEDDEVGDVRESFLVRTDLPGKQFFYYWVHGTVVARSGDTPPKR